MGKQNRIKLKQYYSTGKVPTQGNYEDLIDSFINLEDSATQIIQGGVSSSGLEVGLHITASGNISASGYISSSQFFGDLSASYVIMPFESDLLVNANITGSGNLRINGSASFGYRLTNDKIQNNSGNITASGALFENEDGTAQIVTDV